MLPIKTALVGFGLSGSVFHGPLISANSYFKLHAVVSSKPDVVLSRYPNVTVLTLQQVLDDKETELVVLASPNHLHYEQAKAVLNAGKHLVIEKPMALSSAQGLELVNLAKENQCQLSVFHNRRWDSDYLTAKRVIREQQLGSLHSYQCQFDRYRPVAKQRWKEAEECGGGVLNDLGAHLIDQALNLFGLPESVYADIQTQRENSGADDAFYLRLRYPKLMVELRSNSLVVGQAAKLTLLGDQGSLYIYGTDAQESQLSDGMSTSETGYGLADQTAALYHAEKGQSELEPEKGCYPNFYQQVFAAIRLAEVMPVTGEEAVNVLKVIELARRSSASRSEVLMEC